MTAVLPNGNAMIALFPADFILVVHFAWAAWMVSGVAVAVLGFRWHRFWRWRIFRTAHLFGLIATASTPLWPSGTCPLTIWEWELRAEPSTAAQPGSFIIHWLHEALFWDVDPVILSLISAAAALFTVVMFFLRSPRKMYR
jgi:hypothetical protein